jgi:hypothetical protein
MSITPRHHVVATAALLLLAGGVIQLAAAGPFITHDHPGEGIASTYVRWLAPFVQETLTVWGELCCEDCHSDCVVQWFDPNGKVISSLSEVSSAGEGYVVKGGIVYGTNHRWQHTLEQREGWESHLSVEDGRFMLRMFEFEMKLFEVQLFDRGILVGQYGPFRRSWLGPGPYLADDGHLVIPRAGDNADETILLAINPDGSVSFETSINGYHHVLGFNGTTLLVADSNQTEPIRSITAEGETAKFIIPGHTFRGWIPGSSRAVFGALGWGYYLMVVDCFTGGIEWLRREEETRISSARVTTVAISNLILIGSVESRNRKSPDLPIHVLRAFDADTGALVGRWERGARHEGMSFYGRFVTRDEQLYWMTNEDFSKISAEDIRTHKNGWRL